jgi:glycosyltransferase involved in cell wall biosynthesis
MKTLTIISPVYNEESVIEAFYNELSVVLASLHDRYETNILFVLDRCTDRTLAILKEIAQRDQSVQILAMSGRFGHQMALLAGIDHCHADAIVMMDGDLQHPPGLIPTMLEQYEQGYDIVYTIREDALDSGLFKQLSSRLFYRLVNWISEIPISESAADFRLISRAVAVVFQQQIRERNQFMRGLFSWVGFENVGVRFQARNRFAGKTKYSLRRMVRFGLQGIISFSKRPLQLSIIMGMVFALFSFAYALISVIQYFIYASLPSGWTTLVFMVSLSSGVQLICLGLIGEYIGAIFDEVKGRPHYIVAEKINFHHD